MSTLDASSADQIITDTAGPSGSTSQNSHVDPDTDAGLPNPKRVKLELGEGKKIRVLTAIIEAYAAICNNLKFTETMMNENLNTSNRVTAIMYTLHKKCLCTVTGITSNASKKTAPTTVTVNSQGNLFTSTLESLIGLWTTALENNGLQYRKFAASDAVNWFDTMNVYLLTFKGFGLRIRELHLGYWNMAISTADGKLGSVPIAKYGLTGHHSSLLEGISYPPMIRKAMAPYVGPMTAFLCMIRSRWSERKMWAEIVRRCWSMISFIDAIIKMTKDLRTVTRAEITHVVVLLAEILLTTTATTCNRFGGIYTATTRHGSWKHMHFPLCMLYKVYSQSTVEHRVALLDRFHYEGDGGYYLYKECQADTMASWVIEGNYTPEQAAQLVFHSIFGTSRADLTILEQITDISTWFRRDQLGNCFKLRLYPKFTPGNQIDFCIREFSCQPVFSGYRVCNFGRHFFYRIQEQEILHGAGRNLTQITGSLGRILHKLSTELTENNGILPGDVAFDMETTSWRTMASLTLTEDGAEAEDGPRSKPDEEKYFMEKSSD